MSRKLGTIVCIPDIFYNLIVGTPLIDRDKEAKIEVLKDMINGKHASILLMNGNIRS